MERRGLKGKGGYFLSSPFGARPGSAGRWPAKFEEDAGWQPAPQATTHRRSGLQRISTSHCRVVVTIVVADPLHRSLRIFVAALGREIEQVVGADQQIESARIGRVGAVDVPIGTTSDDAEAGRRLHPDFIHVAI